jgi:tape measure domain-containing protein
MAGFLATFMLKLGMNTDDVTKGLKGVRRDLDSWSRDLTAFGQRLTAGVTLPLAGVGIAALKVAGELEQNAVAFKTMLGSAEAAKQHLNDLKQFALATPFEFRDLTIASKRLQALGFDAKQVIPTLTSVGDAAAALGSGAEGIQRITTALGQMRAKGKIQAEEMKQLAEAGIPAWEMLAKVLNTDVAGAMKLVEKRAVDSGIAVPAILAGISEKFGGMMKEQSKTLLGQLAQLREQITFTLQDIGKTLTPMATQMMEGTIKPLLASVKDLAAGFAAMPPGMQQAAIAMTAFLAAVGPATWIIGGTASGLSNIVSLALKLPAAINPVTLAIVALGAAASIGFYELNKGTAVLRDLDATFSKFITGLVTMETDFEYAHKKLDKALADGLIGMSEYNTALAILEDREKKAFGSSAQSMLNDWGITVDTSLVKPAKVATTATAEMGKEAERAADKFRKLRDEMVGAQVAFAGLGGGDVFNTGAGPIGFVGPTEKQLKSAHEAMMDQLRNLPMVERGGDLAGLPAANRSAELLRDTLGAVATEADLAARNTAILGQETVKTGSASNIYRRQISTVVSDLGRTLGDVIFRTKSLGDALRDVGRAGVRLIGEDLIQYGFGKLVKYIVSDVLPHLGKVGKALAGILGGGASGAAGAASGAASAAGSAASGVGSVASGAGSVASSASSGLMGALNTAFAGVSAGMAVVSGFQQYGMNKSLDLIVNHTLRQFNVAAQTLDFLYVWNAQWFTRTGEMWQAIIDVKDAISRGGGAGGKGSLTFNNCSFNGTPQQNAAAIFQYAELAGVL